MFKILTYLCKHSKKIMFILIYGVCIFITFILYKGGHYLLMHIVGKDPVFPRFVNYNFPFILIASVSLLLFFSRLSLTHYESLIRLASPLAFSVYLIQCQDLIWKHLFNNAFTWVANLPAWLLPFVIISMSLLVYVSCSFIDYTRLLLFRLMARFSKV